MAKRMHTVTVTKKLSIPFDKLGELRQDLRKLNEPGYGGGMNICYGDGYYAKSLEQKWHMSVSEMEALCKAGRKSHGKA